MSERLENFIRNNRKQFNEFEAPEGLWDKIEQDLDEQARIRPLNRLKSGLLLKIAAMIVVVLTSGLLFFQYQKKEATDLSNINPELAKQQYHYASLIKEKRNELKEIEKQDPHLYREFSSEIKAMDENYQRLKKDLKTSPNQEETVRAMVKNLQIQIQVLNQQLQIIEQVSEFKKGEKNGMQSI
jgi:predicted transcriptional regulator